MNIGIIGGTRGLGKTLAGYFKDENFNVTITGRDETVGNSVSEELGVSYSSDNISVVKSSDIVIISVPISSTLNVIKDLAPFMSPGSLLLDVTSVKEKPAKIMAEYVPEGVDFIPTHPVFGPRTSDLDGQIVVLTPIKKGEWYSRVKSFLVSKNVRVIESSPVEHDKMMAVVQVLTHFSYISTAYTIAKLQVNIKETQNFESPIYNLMLDTIARIVSQNPFLTYSIQYENNQGGLIRDTFLEAVSQLKDAISKGDEDSFVEMATFATKNMGDIQSALGRSDKAVNSLTHEYSILKDSIGKVIGLKHIYSGNVHVGVLKDLGPDFLTLVSDKEFTKLKVANIEILSSDELFSWRVDNEKVFTRSLSVVFPLNSDAKVISNILSGIGDVVSVDLVDTYGGPQIDEGFISYTFNVSYLGKSTFDEISKVVRGFGGVIR